MITDNAKNYLSSFVRDVKQIDTLRRIELSILVIGLSAALAEDAWRAFLIAGGTCTLLFAWLELGIRGEMQLRNEYAAARARQTYLAADDLAATPDGRFSGPVSFTLKLRAARNVLTLPQFYGWQLALLLSLAILSFFCL